jgi:hypothetical protein
MAVAAEVAGVCSTPECMTTAANRCGKFNSTKAALLAPADLPVMAI